MQKVKKNNKKIKKTVIVSYELNTIQLLCK